VFTGGCGGCASGVPDIEVAGAPLGTGTGVPAGAAALEQAAMNRPIKTAIAV
jgi:hypothetical protein